MKKSPRFIITIPAPLNYTPIRDCHYVEFNSGFQLVQVPRDASHSEIHDIMNDRDYMEEHGTYLNVTRLFDSNPDIKPEELGSDLFAGDILFPYQDEVMLADVSSVPICIVMLKKHYSRHLMYMPHVFIDGTNNREVLKNKTSIPNEDLEKNLDNFITITLGPEPKQYSMSGSINPNVSTLVRETIKHIFLVWNRPSL